MEMQIDGRPNMRRISSVLPMRKPELNACWALYINEIKQFQIIYFMILPKKIIYLTKTLNLLHSTDFVNSILDPLRFQT